MRLLKIKTFKQLKKFNDNKLLNGSIFIFMLMFNSQKEVNLPCPGGIKH